jgi:hypothetical protein
VEECWRPWSSTRPAMGVVLRHKWEAVTHLGAVGRVRPRVFVAVRQPTVRLGQGDRELCSPTMADAAALCASERQGVRRE